MFRSLSASSDAGCTTEQFGGFIRQLEDFHAASTGAVKWSGRLTLSQVQTLASTFKHSFATCISITGNKISTRGVEALAEAMLNANFTITSLDLTGNPGEADAPFAMNIIAFCLDRNQQRTCKMIPHGSTREANAVKLQARLRSTDDSCHMTSDQQDATLQALSLASWKSGLEQLIKQQLAGDHRHQDPVPWAGNALVVKCKEALKQARLGSGALSCLSQEEVVQELQQRLVCIDTVLSQALAAVEMADSLPHAQEGRIFHLLCSLAAERDFQSFSSCPFQTSDTEDYLQTGAQQHDWVGQLVSHAVRHHEGTDDLGETGTKQCLKATDSAYDSAEEDCVASVYSKATSSTATQTDTALQLDSRNQQCSKQQHTQQQEYSRQQASHSVPVVANHATSVKQPGAALRKNTVRFVTAKHRFL